MSDNIDELDTALAVKKEQTCCTCVIQLMVRSQYHTLISNAALLSGDAHALRMKPCTSLAREMKQGVVAGRRAGGCGQEWQQQRLRRRSRSWSRRSRTTRAPTSCCSRCWAPLRQPLLRRRCLGGDSVFSRLSLNNMKRKRGFWLQSHRWFWSYESLTFLWGLDAVYAAVSHLRCLPVD